MEQIQQRQQQQQHRSIAAGPPGALQRTEWQLQVSSGGLWSLRVPQ
jgi:hypothetical protein